MKIEALERRCERLFKKWDAIEDPYGLPIDEFRKAIAVVNEAACISICLNAHYEVINSLPKK